MSTVPMKTVKASMDCLWGDISCQEACKKHETKNGRVSAAIENMKELAAAELTFLKNLSLSGASTKCGQLQN
jgi:hypothetical protein